MRYPRTFFIVFLFAWAALAAEKAKCPICGMNFSAEVATSYEITREGAPTLVCSFVCASRFHQKFPESRVQARDFVTGKLLDARTAFFLVKSRAVLKKLPFDMPPSVVAFGTRESAEKTKNALGDGEIVQGFEKAVKAYE